MNRSRSLRSGLIAAIALAAGLGTAAGAVVDPPSSRFASSSDVDVSSVTGRGESLIIVTADDFPTSSEASEQAAQMTFGDMQGFYLDSTDNYQVTGFYDQTSHDIDIVACTSIGDPAVTCPSPTTPVRAYQPVTLAYVPIDHGAQYLAQRLTAPCGGVGEVPCMANRLARLLRGPGLQLPAGRTLLLTAFRTRTGAEQFVELARGRGYEVSVIRVRKLGGPFVGLGQEAHPDGFSGPLLAPLPNQDDYQR